MAAKKKDLWLVPDVESEPVLLPTPPSGTGMTYEEREVARKYRAHIAEEIAKGAETVLAGEIVDGINRDFMDRGVGLIGFAGSLSREDALDAAEQSTKDAFLGIAVRSGLQDLKRVKDIGVRDIQRQLAEPLTPDRKKWPWQ